MIVLTKLRHRVHENTKIYRKYYLKYNIHQHRHSYCMDTLFVQSLKTHCVVGGSNTDRAKLVLFINKSFKGRLFIHKSGGESVGGSRRHDC